MCLACDDNYAQYAGVVIASVLCNAGCGDELCFYVLDGGVSEEKKSKIQSLKSIKPCEINFVAIDEKDFVEYMSVKTHDYISLPTFYRLKLPTLLPNVDRVVYFDCDMVINCSLRSLFNKDLGKCPVAGVRDLNRRMVRKNPTYVNAGMLVMDLKNMREQNVEREFFEWTKAHKDTIRMGDQEIINETLKGRILVVEDEWNVQSSNFVNRSSYTKYPRVVHFVSRRKPWHYGSFSVHKYLYFKYLQMTPWALGDSDFLHWTKDNRRDSRWAYFKYRPLFFLRPRFYRALWNSYVKPLFENRPKIAKNTFIVWEPCSKSHAEVVPGYVKYLLDLGYNVSVIVNPKRLSEGLFSKFSDREMERVFLNKMSASAVRRYFAKSDLSDVEGVMVTTVGKLCDEVHFDDAYKTFAPNADRSKLFFVEHEAKHAVDAGTWREDLIVLRELDYNEAKAVVVNPHYFGDKVEKDRVKGKVVNLVTIGAIKPYKKNSALIIESVKKLHEQGVRNFKVTVIGKGSFDGVPAEIQKYFDVKGRLSFARMYDELEKADFMLTAYEESDPMHVRYRTTGTSGNFQLVYGFGVPCVIRDTFAPVNGFSDANAVLYKDDAEYAKALQKCVEMSNAEYAKMRENLFVYAKSLYAESLDNIKELINGRC